MAKVFVPLSVAILASDTVFPQKDSKSCVTAAEAFKSIDGESLKEKAHKILEGARGGMYYLSEKGKKIYVDMQPTMQKASKAIRNALDSAKKGLEAFKKSGCLQKCKSALGNAKKYGKIAKAHMDIGVSKIQQAYHGTMLKRASSKMDESGREKHRGARQDAQYKEGQARRKLDAIKLGR